MATLDDLLALLPDNDTGAIDAADLRTIVTELWTRSSTIAEVFGYTWSASASPATGKVAGPWAVGPGTLQISETTGDGAAMSFAVLDALNAPLIRVVSAGGTSMMVAQVTGPAVDMGNYRDVPVNVLSVTAIAPSNNAKVTLAVTAVLL